MRITIGVACFTAAVHALPASTTTLFESLRQVPYGWTSVGKPADDALLDFRIALTARDPGVFERTLYEVSDPSHERYGQHLKRDELRELLRPSKDASLAVRSWLESNGVDAKHISERGEWLNFRTTVANAEELMDTKFHTYHNRHGKINKVRTLRYSVPSELHKHIDMIQPTTRFAQIKPEGSQVLDFEIIGDAFAAGAPLNLTNVVCNNTITPQCLRDLYNVPVNNGLKNSSAGFGAFNNFLEEYPRYADLALFEIAAAPYALNESFTWTSVNGGQLDQTSTSDSVEANLDAQYIISMGYPVPMNAYSTAGRAPLVPDLDQPDASMSANEPYLDFLDYILDQDDADLPHTLSTSYGEDEQSVPLSYRLKVCQLFGQLGARGVSVIFSSGDTGVGSACQTNDGKNTTRFLPTFPAACPYVTSVGGTHYVKPESAISFSSGGFSDTWPTPDYQKSAVGDYLQQLGDRWQGLYNSSGRGIPDVAAQSSNFVVIDKGLATLVGGTSASSPTFAGIVSVLNGLRVQAGQPGLGFLNPWIYSEGYKALNDITHGGSTGCTGKDIYSGLPAPKVPYASWNATVGWDPVTGWGTPDFLKLKALALGGYA
ncbi:hypothetical protein AMS68_000392 [Peltaster fructicola]|uniref:tripeptidyl-peptidase II n=1 Tax=Peltaster fructicola TaxID=286661 RepID=A0A6H0XJT0_9PEZI|nr:hypothetical protein AMS68_000392 [Peltaster fructicola]